MWKNLEALDVEPKLRQRETRKLLPSQIGASHDLSLSHSHAEDRTAGDDFLQGNAEMTLRPLPLRCPSTMRTLWQGAAVTEDLREAG